MELPNKTKILLKNNFSIFSSFFLQRDNANSIKFISSGNHKKDLHRTKNEIISDSTRQQNTDVIWKKKESKESYVENINCRWISKG